MKSFLQFISEADRDYRAERLKLYGGKDPTPKQLAARKKKVQRVLARRKLERDGKVSKGDGKDVDHKNGDALDNRPSNLRVMDRGENRGRDNNKWRDT
jgi:hypothetical protein